MIRALTTVTTGLIAWSAFVGFGPIGPNQPRGQRPATAWTCGSTPITVTFQRAAARVTVGAQTYAMTHVPAASGARYELPGDAATWFWNKGRTATLAVKGKTYPECTPAVSAAPVQPAPPPGGRWIVRDINGAAPVANSRVTISFGEGGRVSGHTSCNTYTGEYTLTGELLTISPPVTTLKACLPPLMTQEGAFLDVLRHVQRFEVKPDGALVLCTGDNRTITARRE